MSLYDLMMLTLCMLGNFSCLCCRLLTFSKRASTKNSFRKTIRASNGFVPDQDQLSGPFKGISYLELWQPFSSVEQNHFCNFRRGYYEEQFSEIILNLGQWFKKRCHLKDFLSGALVALLFSYSVII